MDNELNQALDIVAHLHTALELARVQARRLEQRDKKRLQKARERMNAPIRAEQESAA